MVDAEHLAVEFRDFVENNLWRCHETTSTGRNLRCRMTSEARPSPPTAKSIQMHRAGARFRAKHRAVDLAHVTCGIGDRRPFHAQNLVGDFGRAPSTKNTPSTIARR